MAYIEYKTVYLPFGGINFPILYKILLRSDVAAVNHAIGA